MSTPPQLPSSSPKFISELANLTPAEILVAGFWDMDAFGRACAKHKFGLEAELEMVFKLFKSPDEKTRLSALKYFYKLRTEIARANGLLGGRTAAMITDGAGGAAVMIHEQSSHLLEQLRKANTSDDHRKHVESTITLHKPRELTDEPTTDPIGTDTQAVEST